MLSRGHDDRHLEKRIGSGGQPEHIGVLTDFKVDAAGRNVSDNESSAQSLTACAVKALSVETFNSTPEIGNAVPALDRSELILIAT